MADPFETLQAPETESLLTHPLSQARLAAQMPWWGWVAVGLCFAMAGLMVWYLWPRKPKPMPDLPRDDKGKLIPPWEWEARGIRR